MASGKHNIISRPFTSEAEDQASSVQVRVRLGQLVPKKFKKGPLHLNHDHRLRFAHVDLTEKIATGNPPYAPCEERRVIS